MKARRVLLDRSFIEALNDTTSDMHDDAVQAYLWLITGYANNTLRLFANSDIHVTNELLRPVECLRITTSHRRAASAVDAAVTRELALTLVLVRRETMDVVASFDPEINIFQVATIGSTLSVQDSN